MADVFCANCSKCHVSFIHLPTMPNNVKEQRVTCKAGRWTNLEGNRQKTYAYSTVLNRRSDGCADYDPMDEGPEELAAYLKSLARNLPASRIWRTYAQSAA